jgi:hypothetical protein
MIDNHDIIIFVGQMAGDIESHLAGAANKHFHDAAPTVVLTIVTGDAECL